MNNIYFRFIYTLSQTGTPHKHTLFKNPDDWVCQQQKKHQKSELYIKIVSLDCTTFTIEQSRRRQTRQSSGFQFLKCASLSVQVSLHKKEKEPPPMQYTRRVQLVQRASDCMHTTQLGALKTSYATPGPLAGHWWYMGLRNSSGSNLPQQHLFTASQQANQ